MGERKIFSKYIPADFDPSLVPRGKKLSAKDGTVPVRMMLPFSVQCSNCLTFLYRGRKFNSKKEAMGGPDGVYLGITRWRFYIKCTHCSRPLTFLTDPQNTDYEMESGGTRNYEYTKDRVAQEEDATLKEEKAEKEDPLKALETRVLDSQREMADLENLEEIRAMNARHIKLLKKEGQEDAFDADTQALLRLRHDTKFEEEDVVVLNEQDEELVKSIQFGKRSKVIRRLDEKDEQRAEEQRRREAVLLAERQRDLEHKAQQQKHKKIPLIKVLRKRKNIQEEGKGNSKKEKVGPDVDTSSKDKAEGGGLASLLGGYGSSSNSD
jgi:hypothetical protein